MTTPDNFSPDALWGALCEQAARLAESEPLLRRAVDMCFAGASAPDGAMARLLAAKLDGPAFPAADLQTLFLGAYARHTGLADVMAHDLNALTRMDPAAHDLITPFLFFKGFHALQAWRIAHALWEDGRQKMALFLQGRIATVCGVDIHPAARIGHGVTLDHANGIVIGETAIIGNNVLILHNVTLGTKIHQTGDRHPIIGDNVIIGSGAKILGRIHIGNGAYVAAGSLVLKPVAPGATVAGVPAKPIQSKRLA